MIAANEVLFGVCFHSALTYPLSVLLDVLPIEIPLRPILLFVVVLARVGGLVTFAPFWSVDGAAKQVRIALALVLAAVITPIVGPHLATPPSNLISLALLLVGELAIGCMLGFVGQLVFSALEVAAHQMGSLMGFSLAAIINPGTNAQTTALGTMAQMCGLVILLGADGHHWLLSATVRSFQTIQPGGFTASLALAQLCLRLSADALAVGVALAAPALIVLLTVEFALAIAGRVAPQLQVLILGFPVKIAVGFWLVGASLYFLPGAFRDVVTAIHGNLTHALNAMK
jgi:flagellar biosynthetic protein FliR